jgi:hypothetical protein
LHARSLPVVVAQVTIIKFCDQIMSITSIIISVCYIWLYPMFDQLYLVVKLVSCLLCLQRDIIADDSASP